MGNTYCRFFAKNPSKISLFVKGDLRIEGNFPVVAKHQGCCRLLQCAIACNSLDIRLQHTPAHHYPTSSRYIYIKQLFQISLPNIKDTQFREPTSRSWNLLVVEKKKIGWVAVRLNYWKDFELHSPPVPPFVKKSLSSWCRATTINPHQMESTLCDWKDTLQQIRSIECW